MSQISHVVARWLEGVFVLYRHHNVNKFLQCVVIRCACMVKGRLWYHKKVAVQVLTHEINS